MLDSWPMVPQLVMLTLGATGVKETQVMFGAGICPEGRTLTPSRGYGRTAPEKK